MLYCNTPQTWFDLWFWHTMESRQAIRAITIPHSNQFLILRLSRGDGRVAHRLRTADLKKPPPKLRLRGLSVSCRHLPCRRSRRRARPNGLKARFRTCGCSNNPPSRPSVWWRAAVCAGPRRWPRGAWIRNLLGHHHLVGTQPRQRNDHPGQPHAAHRAGDMHGDRAGTPAGRAGRSRWTPPVRRVSCGRSFRACGAGRGSGRTAPASASSNSAVLRSAMSAMPLLSQIVSQQRRSMFSGKTTS